MEINLCFGCMEELPAGAVECPHCGYKVGTPAKEPYHIAPGSILHGRYLVGKALGSGGFGVTYVAMDLVLQQKVAVKEYLPSDFSTRMPGALTVSVYSGESAAQFEVGLQKYIDEAQRLAVLTDIPGVVQIRDYFTDNNTAYIVMELLEGVTLKQRLAEVGKMSYDDTVAIMLPVLNTLEDVHTKTWDDEKKSCIIHRDISPDNIFITNDGRVKLLDFGAARYASTYHSKSLSVILKPGYAPEEQYRSRGEQGPWSDVYGAAATMYKALTGITPEDAMERLNKDELKDPRKLGVEMTENQENALMNALNVKAQDRTPTAGQFAQDLLSVSPVLRNRIKTKKQDEGKVPVWMKAMSGVAAAAVGLLALLIAFGVLDPNPTHWTNRAPDGMVYVPGLINRDVESAQAKTEDNNLVFKITDKQNSALVERDTIMMQDPTAGTLVSYGSIVGVVVSGGVEQIYMLDIANYTLEDARTLLEQEGFVVKIIEEENLDYAAGTVIRQSLEADAAYDKGTVVELVVAAGSTTTDEQVEVPNLLGLTFQQAADTLKKLGLYAVKGGTGYDVSAKDETVLTQSVLPGQSVQKGSTVSVTINQLNAAVFMPDVQYKSREEAQLRLEERGLIAIWVEQESAVVPAGHVISQSIPAYTRVKAGDRVTLVVSLGDDVLVPDTQNKTEAAARKLLEDAGFRVNIVKQYSPMVAKGNVIDTNPMGGSYASRGSTINVYLSEGKDPKSLPVDVPNVIGLTSDAARAALQKAELGVLEISGYSDEYPAGQIFDQSPWAGAQVERGTQITIYVSKGPAYVSVPSVMGVSQDEAINRLSSAGFSYQVERVYNDSYGGIAEGLVCSQTPAAGTSVHVENRGIVTIYISLGSAYRTVPNVVGMSQDAAVNAIRAAGITNINITKRHVDETVAAYGAVLEQDVMGRVLLDSTVTITVSNGTEDKWVLEADLWKYPASNYDYIGTKTQYRYQVRTRMYDKGFEPERSGWETYDQVSTVTSQYKSREKIQSAGNPSITSTEIGFWYYVWGSYYSKDGTYKSNDKTYTFSYHKVNDTYSYYEVEKDRKYPTTKETDGHPYYRTSGWLQGAAKETNWYEGGYIYQVTETVTTYYYRRWSEARSTGWLDYREQGSSEEEYTNEETQKWTRVKGR